MPRPIHKNTGKEMSFSKKFEFVVKSNSILLRNIDASDSPSTSLIINLQGYVVACHQIWKRKHHFDCDSHVKTVHQIENAATKDDIPS
jgi:hypothetical protein